MVDAIVAIIIGSVISGLTTYFLRNYPVLKFIPGVLGLGFGIYLLIRFRHGSILMKDGALSILGIYLIIISVTAFLIALFVRSK